jgi:hypothetical protein
MVGLVEIRKSKVRHETRNLGKGSMLARLRYCNSLALIGCGSIAPHAHWCVSVTTLDRLARQRPSS